MARRSDNPLSILVMGLFTIAFFGGVVVYFNETKPILKLRPRLEQRFSSQGFRTRFVPPRGVEPSYIIVEVPPELADPLRRLEIGAWALEDYVELAKGQTLVQSCEVRVAGRPKDEPVRVSRAAQRMVDTARRRVDDLREAIARAGLRRVEVEVTGLSFSGVRLRARGRLRGPKAKPEVAGRKALRNVERLGFVGYVELTIRHAGNELVLRGGRDAPRFAASRSTPASRPTP
ncbi:MAG: hypothetical protein D6731_05085, partial [Planctomycetota bacterium]